LNQSALAASIGFFIRCVKEANPSKQASVFKEQFQFHKSNPSPQLELEQSTKMKITLEMRLLQLLLAAATTGSATAFAPSPFARSLRIKSSLAYLDDCNSDTFTCNISPTLTALDAEMDTFASPNDKRYSASDWWHNMQNFRHSSILSQIRGPVGVITVWSTMVSLIYKACVVKGWSGAAEKLCLSSTPHSFIASTIGLLLVFRTNSAYQKFRVSWRHLRMISLLTKLIQQPDHYFDRRDAKRGKSYSTQHETLRE
jgi:hypothetical protein